MNSTLITDKYFLDQVMNCINEIKVNDEAKLAEQWEEFKQRIKIKAIDRSCAFSYERKMNEKTPKHFGKTN